jgi:uncharacterized protein YndB with AHSA1/START domain
MTEATEVDAVVLERRFDAPAEVIWRLWTDPDHFAQWYGPDGANIPVATMDVRVGGRRHLAMEVTTPDGSMRMWFTGEYLDVVPRERLVYTESISDEQGNVLTPEAAGMPAGHPVVTEVRVDLREHDGVTTVTVTHAGVPANSPGAAGWAMALAKLELLVAEIAGP